MIKKIIASSPVLLFAGCAQQGSSRGLPWWGWLLLILALALIIYLIIKALGKKEVSAPTPPEPELEPEPVLESESVTEPEPILSPEPLVPDELTLIEGIGPKIQSILRENGIHTFAQLAEMAPEAIKTLLTDAGLRLGVTDTWPEQARLAARGALEELKDFQDKLTGGRKA